MGTTPAMGGRLIWVVVHHEETRRPINVFVLGTTPSAVLYSHRAGRWESNPAAVADVTSTNRVEGLDRLRTTDRAGAEEAARQFGATLPTDEELRLMLTAAPMG